jgi:DNA-binding response OmpR family regulator
MARLLLIDDDDPLRELLAEALAAAGHTVTQAADGRLAMSCSEIDLVITDLVMPGHEGLETIVALHREYPDLPVIAISGAPANSRIYLKMASLLGAHCALPKPFTAAELIRLVDQLLQPPAGPPGPSR